MYGPFLQATTYSMCMAVQNNRAVSTRTTSWPAKFSTFCSASSSKFGFKRFQEHIAKIMGLLTQED